MDVKSSEIDAQTFQLELLRGNCIRTVLVGKIGEGWGFGGNKEHWNLGRIFAFMTGEKGVQNTVFQPDFVIGHIAALSHGNAVLEKNIVGGVQYSSVPPLALDASINGSIVGIDIAVGYDRSGLLAS